MLIPELGRSVKTDESGNFEINNIPPGNYHLEVIKVGYIPFRSDPFSTPQDELNFEVILSQKLKEEIVVSATRREVSLKEVPVRTEVISEREIEESGAKTVSEVLNKELLGIWVSTSCTNCNFTELRMQGLEGKLS